VIVVPLSLPTRCVLGEERFEHLLEVVEKMWRHGVEPISDHTFQTGREGEAHKQIIAGVDFHFVPKIPDVLDRVARSRVVGQGWS